MSEAKVTTDHQKIRNWAEKRGGKPPAVKGTGRSDDPGLLRIDFPGYTGEESLQEITGSSSFDKFEKERLAFLYQEETEEGSESRFSKLLDGDQSRRSESKQAGKIVAASFRAIGFDAATPVASARTHG